MSEPNGREIITENRRVGVLLPLVFARPFDYRVPSGMELRPGDYVRVPFGRKSVWGVVWQPAQGAVGEEKLKSVQALAGHLPPMTDAMRAFLAWVAWYTLAPLGLVLKMALPMAEALEPPGEEDYYCLPEGARFPVPYKPTPARLRIAAYMTGGEARTMKAIMQHAKVSAGIVREFIRAEGIVRAPSAAAPPVPPCPELPAVRPSLSGEQQAAAEVLRGKLAKGYSVTLLDGVTGSGKTEVYFDAISYCITMGKQALVLLPEIALSIQWLTRFEARFGFRPEVWHSGVTPAARRKAWQKIASGETRVIVGARSALFLPFAALGLMVVDEEHDASYKQEDGVIYHARDMAVARAQQEKIPVVLASATPSLETEYNVQRERYGRVGLGRRHHGAALPAITLVDMRAQKLPKERWLSEPLKAQLSAALARGEQSMLFINRRGYAPLMLCRACGHRFSCPNCAAFLVLHRKRARLLCHYCGHEAPLPDACPDCNHTGTIIPFGPGVERVAEEARLLYPNARIAAMTSDEIDTPAKAAAIFAGMTEGRIDILIGTQMIAKGHHFAGLALVGVIDADMGLAGGDLRAGERTYQLLHQVAGRAGREKIKGEVLLQTYLPDHPVMQALQAGDRDRFMALEAEMRQQADMPPYGKLAALIVEGANEKDVAACARMLVRAGHDGHNPGIPGPAPLILGPAPAPLALLRGRHRWRVLIKAPRRFGLQEWLRSVLSAGKIPSGLKVKTDVEPYSFL